LHYVGAVIVLDKYTFSGILYRYGQKRNQQTLLYNFITEGSDFLLINIVVSDKVAALRNVLDKAILALSYYLYELPGLTQSGKKEKVRKFDSFRNKGGLRYQKSKFKDQFILNMIASKKPSVNLE